MRCLTGFVSNVRGHRMFRRYCSIKKCLDVSLNYTHLLIFKDLSAWRLERMSTMLWDYAANIFRSLINL